VTYTMHTYIHTYTTCILHIVFIHNTYIIPQRLSQMKIDRLGRVRKEKKERKRERQSERHTQREIDVM
jgi:hypothetical protein